MKSVLVILSTLLLLPAFLGRAANSTTDAARDTVSTATAEPELSDVERTAKYFSDFIYLEVLPKATAYTACGDPYYTGFANGLEAYATFIDFIFPAYDRLEFDRLHRYKSDLIEFHYSDRPADGGFARICVIFKRNEQRKKDEYRYVVLKAE